VPSTRVLSSAEALEKEKEAQSEASLKGTFGLRNAQVRTSSRDEVSALEVDRGSHRKKISWEWGLLLLQWRAGGEDVLKIRFVVRPQRSSFLSALKRNFKEHDGRGRGKTEAGCLRDS